MLELRKTYKGKKGNYWSFNNSRLIVDEDLFDWNEAGLRASLQKNAQDCAKDKDAAKSNTITISTYGIECLSRFKSYITRRQNKYIQQVRFKMSDF